MPLPSFFNRMAAGFLLVGGLTTSGVKAQQSDIIRASARVGYDSFMGAGSVAHRPFSASANFDLDRFRNTPFGLTVSAKKYLVGNATNGGTKSDNAQINPETAAASLGVSLRGGIYRGMRDENNFLAGMFVRNQFLLKKKNPAQANDAIVHKGPSMLQDIGFYFGIEGGRIGFRAEASAMLNKTKFAAATLPNGTVLGAFENAPLYFGIGVNVNLFRNAQDNYSCAPY